MSRPSSGRLLKLARFAAIALGLVPAALAAQGRTATVEGTVRDAGSNRPLESVQVFVVGTSNGAVTNAQGTYRLVVPNVTGEFRLELRARTIGYTQVTRAANVVPDQVAKVDFSLQQSSLQLDQVVVTGSGQATEVKKLGNTVAIVKPPENMPMSDVSNILQGREPGLVGLPSGGLTGEGAKIRIRGNSSLSQSNEPIIFVDGIRINAGGGQAANGNVGSSRLDDFDPNSIEREEICEENELVLVKVKIYESGEVLRANLYFTGKKDMVLRNYRAQERERARGELRVLAVAGARRRRARPRRFLGFEPERFEQIRHTGHQPRAIPQ